MQNTAKKAKTQAKTVSFIEIESAFNRTGGPSGVARVKDAIQKNELIVSVPVGSIGPGTKSTYLRAIKKAIMDTARKKAPRHLVTAIEIECPQRAENAFMGALDLHIWATGAAGIYNQQPIFEGEEVLTIKIKI